jgi:hypothetical protein
MLAVLKPSWLLFFYDLEHINVKGHFDRHCRNESILKIDIAATISPQRAAAGGGSGGGGLGEGGCGRRCTNSADNKSFRTFNSAGCIRGRVG